jgi:hypothetical protein
MNIDVNKLYDLERAGRTGLDGSPGDKLSRWAHDTIVKLGRELEDSVADGAKLVKLLEIVEVSDNEREFRPNIIHSCRVLDGKEMEEIFARMKARKICCG